jgi:hypothetical protein
VNFNAKGYCILGKGIFLEEGEFQVFISMNLKPRMVYAQVLTHTLGSMSSSILVAI